MQEQDSLTIPRAALGAALGLVPPEMRGEFALRLLGLNEEAALPATTDDDPPWSFPITVDQARQLLGKIDKLTAEVLKAAVASPKDNVGTVDWSEIKRITGVTNWSHFARGRLGGLNRALRGITNKEGSNLLWEAEGWIEDGKGDYSVGTMSIDGPAVRSLQVAMNISPN